jgi:hypothetical protein
MFRHAIAFLTLAALPGAAAPIVLNYTFSFSAIPQDFVTVSAMLDGTGGWRVGGIPATNAQILSALSNITFLHVAATGSTSNPLSTYGFLLQSPNLGGVVSTTFPPENGWVSGSGPYSAGPLGFLFEGTHASMTALTAIAPSGYRGNQSAAFGGVFSFQFAISQVNASTSYDTNSGVIVLIGDTAPEPASFILAGGALGILWAGRIRRKPARGQRNRTPAAP